MTASRIFLLSCLSLIGGVLLGSFFYFSQIILLSFWVLGIFLISVFWKERKLVVAGFGIFLLISGILRQQSVANALERPELKGLANQRVILEGIVREEPSNSRDRIRFKLSVDELRGKEIKRNWSVLVTTRPYPEIRYGDELKIEGILKEPTSFDDFDYQSYLKHQRIYFLMNYPRIERTERNRGNFFQAALFSFKNSLKNSLQNFLPAPQFGLIEALMFGEEHNISSVWKEKMNVSGTRHIVAVSGMNITIISNIVLAALLALGLWRRQAFYLATLIIFLFILMIGAPAPAVRAGVMGTLLLAAQNFGYLVEPRRLMIFALTLMLLINPLILKEIGFQLSFLAVWGLIELQKPLRQIFQQAPRFFQLRESLSATFAAQIFAFPLLIYNFGQVSLIAGLSNILILPLLPYLTILGFVLAFLGMLWEGLGQVLAGPIWLLATYLIKVIDFSSQLPWASLSARVPGMLVFFFYLGLIVLLIWRSKRSLPPFLS